MGLVRGLPACRPPRSPPPCRRGTYAGALYFIRPPAWYRLHSHSGRKIQFFTLPCQAFSFVSPTARPAGGKFALKISGAPFRGVLQQASTAQFARESDQGPERPPSLPARHSRRWMPLDQYAREVPIPIEPVEDQHDRHRLQVLVGALLRRGPTAVDINVPPAIVRRRALGGVIGKRS